jgi:hypothetical protein
VAEVASVGGFARISGRCRSRRRAYDIPLNTLYTAIASSNERRRQVGRRQQHRIPIRGIGWLRGVTI